MSQPVSIPFDARNLPATRGHSPSLLETVSALSGQRGRDDRGSCCCRCKPPARVNVNAVVPASVIGGGERQCLSSVITASHIPRRIRSLRRRLVRIPYLGMVELTKTEEESTVRHPLAAFPFRAQWRAGKAGNLFDLAFSPPWQAIGTLPFIIPRDRRSCGQRCVSPRPARLVEDHIAENARRSQDRTASV